MESRYLSNNCFTSANNMSMTVAFFSHIHQPYFCTPEQDPLMDDGSSAPSQFPDKLDQGSTWGVFPPVRTPS